MLFVFKNCRTLKKIDLIELNLFVLARYEFAQLKLWIENTNVPLMCIYFSSSASSLVERCHGSQRIRSLRQEEERQRKERKEGKEGQEEGINYKCLKKGTMGKKKIIGIQEILKTVLFVCCFFFVTGSSN